LPSACGRHDLPPPSQTLILFLYTPPPPPPLYPLSLHDALPIFAGRAVAATDIGRVLAAGRSHIAGEGRTVIHTLPIGYGLDAATDRKSTRLNSSHVAISYAVFCLKKKKQKNNTTVT